MKNPELPSGMSVDDLRYVNEQVYSLDMAVKGWMFAGSFDVDGNPAKVQYQLSRAVDGSFGQTALEALGHAMDICDEDGAYKAGYSLSIDSFRDDPHLGQQVYDAINGYKGPMLIFRFKGFPTQHTMHALTALEEAFMPIKQPSRIRRLLGKVGLR